MTVGIDPKVFDRALIESALHLAGEQGWHGFSLVDAARDAGLPIEQVRLRYPFKGIVLVRLNRLADEASLHDIDSDMTLREKLFDLCMRRLDAFQEYRSGLRKVLHTLPRDPTLAALIGTATFDSLRWIADCAGLDRRGLRGTARLHGLAMVWAHTVRTWEKDDSPDLSNTMNTLDQALNRAEQFGFLKSISRPVETHEEEGGLPDYTPDDTKD